MPLNLFMEFYVEWRQRGDSYNNGYGNGHTLSQSESVQKMKEVEKCGEFTKYECANRLEPFPSASSGQARLRDPGLCIALQ